jgi:hypothetical protein
MVTGRFPLQKANDAVAAAQSLQGLRTVIDMSD